MSAKISAKEWLRDDGRRVFTKLPDQDAAYVDSLVTAAAGAAPSVTEQAKAECSRRIYAVVPIHTQMNFAHALAAGLLSGQDLTDYQAGFAWINSMRAAWKTMEADGDDPFDDASWPAVPAALPALVSRY